MDTVNNVHLIEPGPKKLGKLSLDKP
jgi:hypothetical protein